MTILWAASGSRGAEGALTAVAVCGDLPAMREAAEEFCRHIEAVLGRFLRQNEQSSIAPEELAGISRRLWELVEERGLPPPLAAHEKGTPGEMSESECAPLVARVLGPAGAPLLADAVRQLVKACFYPEFRACRDSFCEVDAAGVCRRQDLARARRRVSGSHCVDCPYWVALAGEKHAKFLARRWRMAPTEFVAYRSVFLPEDFRALRRWVRARAERSAPPR